MESEKWKVESGKWKVESGKWKAESGKWKVESGKWKAQHRDKFMAKNDLEERTKIFALAMIDLVEGLPRNRAGDVVGRQLLRSATSVGANYREANRGVSRDDFIDKVGISTKEASESEFWLELICESPHLKAPNSLSLLQESREILAILTTIGKNAKKNRP